MEKRWSYQDFDGFGRWVAERLRRRRGRPASPATIRSKQVQIAGVANRFEALDQEFLATLLTDRRQIGILLDEFAARLTPGAVRNAVYALRDFGAYGVSRGWITDDIALTDQDLPGTNPAPPVQVYSAEEMAEFVAAAKGRNLRWWAFLTFLVDTGRRVGEALSLEWSWFRLDAQPVPYVQLPMTKNGEPQYIPLTRRLVGEVFNPTNILRFQNERRTGHRAWKRSAEVCPFPWGYSSVHTRFDYFCEVTGLPNRGFHNFRHTVITERLAQGVPLQIVSALAGHASPMVTATRYNHVNALSALPQWGEKMGY
jgi:integrase